MDQVALVLHLLQEIDPGQLFGWVQAFFEQLGVWVYLQMAVTLAIVIASVGAVMRLLGR